MTPNESTPDPCFCALAGDSPLTPKAKSAFLGPTRGHGVIATADIGVGDVILRRERPLLRVPDNEEMHGSDHDDDSENDDNSEDEDSENDENAVADAETQAALLSPTLSLAEERRRKAARWRAEVRAAWSRLEVCEQQAVLQLSGGGVAVDLVTSSCSSRPTFFADSSPAGCGGGGETYQNRGPVEGHGTLDEDSGSTRTQQLLDAVERIIAANSFSGVKTADDDGSGKLLFQYRSRFNHSCLPNAMCVQKEPFTFGPSGATSSAPTSSSAPSSTSTSDRLLDPTVIRAARPIRAGEEITLSYIWAELFNTRQRKKMLRSRYGFDCNCPLCREYYCLPGDADLSSAAFVDELDVGTTWYEEAAGCHHHAATSSARSCAPVGGPLGATPTCYLGLTPQLLADADLHHVRHKKALFGIFEEKNLFGGGGNGQPCSAAKRQLLQYKKMLEIAQNVEFLLFHDYGGKVAVWSNYRETLRRGFLLASEFEATQYKSRSDVDEGIAAEWFCKSIDNLQFNFFPPR
eukprot:g910.t1